MPTTFPVTLAGTAAARHNRAVLIAIALAIAAATLQLPDGFVPCHPAKTVRRAQCGRIAVRENRFDPASRSLSLATVIFPSGSPAPRSAPLLFLAGGPGQGAASLAALILRLLDGVDRDRTVILVDVRGSGSSNPLTCEDTGRVMRGARNESFDRCLAALRRRADLRHYTTADIVEDLEEVRAFLAVDQFDLVAVSWGTRVAVEYLLRHPSRVHAAVLRGADPMDGKTFLHADRGAERALASILDDCARDRSCAMAYPALRREAASIPQLLARQAREVEVVDPQTSKKRRLDASYPLYHDLLYALMLDEVGRRQVPDVIHTIATEGVNALARIAARDLGGYDDVSAGLYYSVVCAEDDPRLTSEERIEMGRLETGAAEADDRCRVWPHPDPLPAPIEIRKTSVPVLVISGEDDPATSAEGAAALAAKLGAQHIIIPAGSHTPLFPECSARLVREFLDQRSPKAIDARCLRSRKRQEFLVRRR